jgi:hypothetical protein
LQPSLPEGIQVLGWNLLRISITHSGEIRYIDESATSPEERFDRRLSCIKRGFIQDYASKDIIIGHDAFSCKLK